MTIWAKTNPLSEWIIIRFNLTEVFISEIMCDGLNFVGAPLRDESVCTDRKGRKAPKSNNLQFVYTSVDIIQLKGSVPRSFACLEMLVYFI